MLKLSVVVRWFVFMISMLTFIAILIYCQLRNTITTSSFIYLMRSNQQIELVNDDIELVYRYLAKNKDSSFINFGYVPVDGLDNYSNIPDNVCVDYSSYLHEQASARLVSELIADTELTNKLILDVGMGKGGALKFINENFRPKKLIGVDIVKDFVTFAKNNYKDPVFEFKIANAQSLPFVDSSFDVVLNIESSNSYAMPKFFFIEAARVLKPGGVLLYTDIFLKQHVRPYLKNLRNLGFVVEIDRDITKNVLVSRQLYGKLQRKTLILPEFKLQFEAAVRKLFRVALQEGVSKDFFAEERGLFYTGMEQGSYVYKMYKLRKL